MKKIAVVLLLAFIFALVFSQAAFAGFVTAETQESTTAATYEGYEDDMVRGQDITTPIIVCFIAVFACIIYGITEIRKHKNDYL